MNLDELHERVTEAILRAEALEEHGLTVEMRAAYLTVISCTTPPPDHPHPSRFQPTRPRWVSPNAVPYLSP